MHEPFDPSEPCEPSGPFDPFDPSPDAVRAMGAKAVDAVASYLASVPGRRIFPDTDPAGLRAALDPDLPEHGEPFDALLDVFRDVIVRGTRHNGHPRFFGYVAAPGTAATAFADLLASALNSNVTAWRSGPAAAEVERLTIGWIRDLFGLPPTATGLFVSGGSTANFSALAAARAKLAPWIDAGTPGPAARVYVSAEAHHSIAKAARMLGIGRANVVEIPVDAGQRLDLAALDAAVARDRAAGHVPLCVCGSAGTVGTGAIDPLREIGALARRYGAWFHVDAAYGGFAALSAGVRARFAGIEDADSVTLDPHKWLYVPVDCGCVLYRDPAAARAAFAHDAEYTRVMQSEPDEAFAFWDYGPELSRRFRALKVWMMLRHAGRRALAQAVEANIECARHLERLVTNADDMEMLAPVELSIFAFRVVPPALRGDEAALDALNERVLARLNAGGAAYLSNTRVGGRFALRGCVLNFRTTPADMERLLDEVRVATRSAGS